MKRAGGSRNAKRPLNVSRESDRDPRDGGRHPFYNAERDASVNGSNLFNDAGRNMLTKRRRVKR